MSGRSERLSASTIYLILSGAGALFFALITTVNLVYQNEVAELNPLQLMLVGTALEATIFLCEVPTGVVADVYSRRLSVIIGVFLIGAGFLLEGAVPRFETILLASVIWGVGYTFTSGAEQAWIADEVGEAHAGPIFLRAAQVAQAGGLIGAFASVALASVQLNLPILLGGGFYLLLGIFLVLAMPEHGFRPTPRGERSSWQTMRDTTRDGVRLIRGRPVLLSVVAIGLFVGLYSEGWDRLWVAHILENFAFPALGGLKPVVWFGMISVGATLLSLGATEVVRRRLDTTHHRAVVRALFFFSALQIAGMVVFALAGHLLLAVVAYLGAAAARRVRAPLFAAWVIQSIDSRVRATVLSMNGQVDAFGQIAGGPAVGWLGTATSLRAALLASSALLAPVLLLYARAMGQGHAEAEEGRHPTAPSPVPTEEGEQMSRR